jgi:hypothetical protein
MNQTQTNDKKEIVVFPIEIYQKIASYLDFKTKKNLIQTCKKLFKLINILYERIKNFNDEEFKQGKSSQAPAIALDGILLDCELIRRIRKYYPKLQYLLIDYNCTCDSYFNINFGEDSSLQEIFLKMNISNMVDKCSPTSSFEISASTVENLTWHISRMDPVTFKAITGEHKGTIYLYISNLENLKSL